MNEMDLPCSTEEDDRATMLARMEGAQAHLLELVVGSLAARATPGTMRRFRREAQEAAAVAETLAELALSVSRHDFRGARF